MSNEPEQSRCRKCGAWQDDLDGFGVLLCDACGHCEHPHVADGVCQLCGRAVTLRKGDQRRE